LTAALLSSHHDRVETQSPIGLLPAAGRGLRFGDSGYAKELFPLLLEGAGELTLAPIASLALAAMRRAGAEQCVTVVSRDKTEVVRVLGDGSNAGVSLAYVVQPAPRGLPDVVRSAFPWIVGREVVFAMPDTVFLPDTALATVRERRLATGADLALGVFPADEPERLGPVEIGEGGVVLRVHDKPGATAHRNTWGVACWSPRFTEFCVEWEAKTREANGPEPALGHVFDAAHRNGLKVQAVFFPDGRFLDIGTPKGLGAALTALAEGGILASDQARVGGG
jgi:glucose-1-phosphate thymidylyltransferase